MFSSLMGIYINSILWLLWIMLLAWLCRLYWSFQKTSFWFHWFFFIDFLFLVLLINVLVLNFFSSAYIGLNLLFFLVSLRRNLDAWVQILLSVWCIDCPKFPTKHCFRFISQILVSCVFTFLFFFVVSINLLFLKN